MQIKGSWRLAFGCWTTLGMVAASMASADVMVVANRTPRRVPVQVTLPGVTPWKVTLTPGESRPIFADSVSSISFDTGTENANYSLEPGHVYFVGAKRDGTLDLQQIGLGEKATVVAGLPGSAATTPPAVIPVKILVDDDQVTRQAIWEPMLRKRIAAASEVLHRHAMVKLQVVAVDTWRTDDSVQDFNQTLNEFEQQVDPFPGVLAIGFSSQYELVRGRVHMGGTHGPLRPHILVREWSQHATENEKLELLLHELGHYLGAAHSPEPDSVMRPVLSDGRSRRTDHVLRFDPVNTLLMSMVGEEIRRRRVSGFAEVAPAIKARLQEVYEVLGYAQPTDPAARVLTGQLGRRRSSDPLTDSTRAVLAAMTQAARTNGQLPSADSGAAGPFRIEGDALFEELVRLAAREATNAPKEFRNKAFLYAIGIGIGDPEQLHQLPAMARVLRNIETPAEASIRSTYIGKPTARGRHDLAPLYGSRHVGSRQRSGVGRDAQHGQRGARLAGRHRLQLCRPGRRQGGHRLGPAHARRQARRADARWAVYHRRLFARLRRPARRHDHHAVHRPVWWTERRTLPADDGGNRIEDRIAPCLRQVAMAAACGFAVPIAATSPPPRCCRACRGVADRFSRALPAFDG